MRIFNTLTRQVEDLVPRIPGRINLYSCGPTVYGYAHIGNMRTYIFNDTLRRSLEHFGYDVCHVMNITDVGHLTDDGDDGEDKMELGGRRENLTAWDIARKYTDAFFDHASKLHIKKPSIVCRATDHIREQIDMVRALEDKGFVYKTDDGLYFDTSRFPDYARLGKLDVEGLREGHRIELGHRRHKTDFAVWKLSQAGERRAMEWDSPWGRGFPGWHLECSAMAMHFLGEELDIHTGGVDHIPIHHTNEIAQSQCATGHAPFARYWMHGEFLVLEAEKDDGTTKMSKSLGNVLTVQTLIDRGFDPLAYRMLILQTHYRKQLRFSYDALVSAARGLERLRTLAGRLREEAKGTKFFGSHSERGLHHRREFDASLANDLNTPQAIATVFAVIDDAALPAVEKVALLESFDCVFGLEMLKATSAVQSDVAPEMLELLAQRNAARKAKNWAEADRLRKQIADAGYEILDSADGVATLKRRL